MPIYEFTCEKCGKMFEELLPPSRSGASVPCPSCGTRETSRNFSGFSARSSGAKPGSSSGGGCGPARGRVG